jgi:hypothetical protein
MAWTATFVPAFEHPRYREPAVTIATAAVRGQAGLLHRLSVLGVGFRPCASTSRKVTFHVSCVSRWEIAQAID